MQTQTSLSQEKTSNTIYEKYMGKKFGTLTVIKHVDYDFKNRMHIWECVCDCGTIINKRSCNLRAKSSCPKCNAKRAAERLIEYRKINPKLYTKPKLVKNKRLHDIWSAMKQRCQNPKDDAYASYGGRGIGVCSEWDNKPDGYWNFEKWSFENGYSDDLSIDRIDNNGDYEPSNCRWVDRFVQANNTRTNVFLTYNGETHTMKQWSEILEIPYHIVFQRKQRGWNVEDIFEKPIRSNK